ncbi:pterin-4-alpha-carbinolamine dehydratase [Planctomonas sp. JC2975]|uniref:VOC family protein n=1 Tax=Planctomonas sp. JC2975 TaxID=2729626 RepID=UPI001473C8CE|nr:VOC family protein [Planctomonas sp. JC2975]NNC12147.1 pterin-4-alpha-carbinolamine dehydratase [Planctomonas sp. JC2975]
MVEAITTKRFHELVPGDTWHRVYGGATAYFATGSFDKGVEFVRAIAELADAANHHPDVDLRYPGVTVRLMTHEISDLSERDAALAAQISHAASRLGIEADPTLIGTVQLAIDAVDIPLVLPFWEAALGYQRRGEGSLRDPRGIGPSVWFQQMDAPRPQRNRIHLDLALPRALAQQRIDAAVAAGGRIATDAFAPHWWTLADPEGNEIDIAPWVDDTDWDDEEE